MAGQCALRVSEDTGDLFFNSLEGYRGQFCLSPDSGMRANRMVIDAVKTVLLGACERSTLDHMPQSFLQASFMHSSAKIWIDEDEFALDNQFLPEILHPVWMLAAKDRIRKIDNEVSRGETSLRVQRDEDRLPFWGVRAPYCEWFKVMGAWTSPLGQFVLHKDPDKRARDIAAYGWS
jgi:hypothetical protein